MSKSDYLENKVLDAALNNVSFVVAQAYVSLFSAAPSDAGGGTEFNGNGYARVAASFAMASGGTTSNDVAVTFPESTGAQGTATHFGVHDAATTGNLLYWSPLGASRVVDGPGITLYFPIGDLDITEG